MGFIEPGRQVNVGPLSVVGTSFGLGILAILKAREVANIPFAFVGCVLIALGAYVAFQWIRAIRRDAASRRK